MRSIVLGLISNSLLCCLILGYLVFSPKKYTSNMTILLSGNIKDSSVILQRDGGVVNPGVNLTYSGGQIDPRSLYKEILTSDELLADSAKASKFSIEDFESIKVKIVDPTPNIAIRVSAKTPEEAKEKAELYYQAFVRKVEALRDGEKENKDKVLREDLEKAKSNLEIASNRLRSFRVETGLAYEEQIPQLVTSNKTKELELNQLLSSIEAKRKEIVSLERSLNINESYALSILSIQVDSLLRGQINEYVSTINALESNGAKFTDDNPVMITLNDKRRQIESSITNRSRELSGGDIPISTVINWVNESNGARTQMYAYYLNLVREVRGLSRQYEVLTNRLLSNKELERRLVSSLPRYKELVREYDTRSVIYTNLQSSTALKGNDRYGTYPLFQLISGPSLAKEPSSPNILYALIGGVGGTICIWGFVFVNNTRIKHATKDS